MLCAVAVVSVAACSDGGAEPDEAPSSDGSTDVTHTLEPTDQMRQAAEQQCLDDPEKETGYVRAVDPTSGDVLAELEVPCGPVRDATG